MRATSLWQPHATLCVLPSLADPSIPEKPYETRDWGDMPLGELAIHAAKRWTGEEREVAADVPFVDALRHPELGERWGAHAGDGVHEFARARFSWKLLPLMCIVGVVEVVAVWQVDHHPSGGRALRLVNSPITRKLWHPMPEGDAAHFGDFTPGRYAFELRNPRPLSEPYPLRGRQAKWWALNPSEERAIRERLEVAHG